MLCSLDRRPNSQTAMEAAAATLTQPRLQSEEGPYSQPQRSPGRGPGTHACIHAAAAAAPAALRQSRHASAASAEIAAWHPLPCLMAGLLRLLEHSTVRDDH